jgi:hypothetical protein
VWEKEFLAFMALNYPQVGLAIRDQKVLTKEIEEDLKRGIAAFKATPAGAPTPAAPAAAAK